MESGHFFRHASELGAEIDRAEAYNQDYAVAYFSLGTGRFLKSKRNRFLLLVAHDYDSTNFPAVTASVPLEYFLPVRPSWSWELCTESKCLPK